jgi:hypothetical protein
VTDSAKERPLVVVDGRTTERSSVSIDAIASMSLNVAGRSHLIIIGHQ